MGLAGKIKGMLSDSVRRRLLRWRRPRSLYLLFSRTQPLSDYAGRERGEPIDRRYIEAFLASCSPDVRGRCLEVKDDLYTSRYGGDRVTQRDILDINPVNSKATVIGDLRKLETVADNTYDCFLCTQTLQYIDDLAAAARECYRILKPGGVLLVTVPCLGKVEGIENNVSGNYWRFTTDAVRYIFSPAFGGDQLTLKSWGNALAGMAFWVGMSQEDLSGRKLDGHDPHFPCVVTCRAVKIT